MKEAQPLSPPASCHPRPEPTRAQGKGLQRNNDAAQRLCFLHNASLRDSIAGAGAPSPPLTDFVSSGRG
jgi:hypothetical protein